MRVIMRAALDVATCESSATDGGLIGRVLGEYREMPGLALTMAQASRLWGCDLPTCHRVADALVRRNLLRWSQDGRLVRVQ